MTLLQFSGWEVFLKGNWDAANFVTNYLPFGLFPVTYIAAKLYTRAPLVKLKEMDFYSDLAEIEADT